MSLLEPRCLVCGAPLDKGAPFEKSVRKSEVCSDKCYEFYTTNEDENEQPDSADAHIEAICDGCHRDEDYCMCDAFVKPQPLGGLR